jgi:hypothetical protein
MSLQISNKIIIFHNEDNTNKKAHSNEWAFEVEPKGVKSNFFGDDLVVFTKKLLPRTIFCSW